MEQYSLHRLASVHEVITNLTGAKYPTSLPNIELSNSRVHRDNRDLKTITDYFYEHCLFDINERQLEFISVGVVADDSINCDKAESIGSKIKQSLDDVIVSEAKIKRNDMILTLDSINNCVKIKSKVTEIDPMILFNRLVVLAERSDQTESAFDCKLTVEPTAFF